MGVVLRYVLVCLIILLVGTTTMLSVSAFGEQTSTILSFAFWPNARLDFLFSCTLILAMFVSPGSMIQRWRQRERVLSAVLAAGCIAACCFIAAMVLQTNPFGFPGWASHGSFWDGLQTYHGIGLILIFLILAVSPTALLSDLKISAAWRWAKPIATSSARPKSTPCGDRLWIVLDALLSGSPGPVDKKTSLQSDGTLVTSQGALADRLDTSKGSINRALRELERAGRIVVITDRRETRIRKAGA